MQEAMQVLSLIIYAAGTFLLYRHIRETKWYSILVPLIIYSIHACLFYICVLFTHFGVILCPLDPTEWSTVLRFQAGLSLLYFAFDLEKYKIHGRST